MIILPGKNSEYEILAEWGCHSCMREQRQWLGYPINCEQHIVTMPLRCLQCDHITRLDMDLDNLRIREKP